MSDMDKELEGSSYEEIQQRAYELYLKEREQFSAQEYWLRAEEELRLEQEKRREPIPAKGKTLAGGAVAQRRPIKSAIDRVGLREDKGKLF